MVAPSILNEASLYRFLEEHGDDRVNRNLVKTGLVDTYILNDVTFYSLTTNSEKRRLVLELATLDWDQWHFMLNRLE